ncbi:MAG: hypothetical protein LBK57_03800 [Clostridiales Family XIII bacterium]|jgi:hypothetical protein|nr:hypothetical protein [Clostridiales Family XIII bacterium]
MIYPRENATYMKKGKQLVHLYIDTTDDVTDLPGLDTAAPGSDAYCVAAQDVYILSGAGTWEVQ